MPWGGTMPLTEVDPNVNTNGRNSRSSVSTGSAIHRDARHQHGIGKSDVLASASVLSMLKTTTETGDIGTLSTISNRLPKLPRGPSRRPSGNSLSRASSHYSRTASIRSKASNHTLTENAVPPVPGSWPHGRPTNGTSRDLKQERRPLHRLTSAPEHPRLVIRSPLDSTDPEQQRSYSLTASLAPSHSLSNQRSTASLRSHDTGSRPRSPVNYSMRLRQPGHRSASPAWSDSNNGMHHGTKGIGLIPSYRAYSTAPVRHNLSRNLGFPEGSSHAGIPRLLQPLEDFNAPFMPPKGPHESVLPFEPQSLRGINSPSTVFPHPPTYGRSSQLFKNNPSPLAEGYSRFAGNHFPNSFAPAGPRTGFVQRVKNLLEERASVDHAPTTHVLNQEKHVDRRPHVFTRSVSAEAQDVPMELNRISEVTTGRTVSVGFLEPQSDMLAAQSENSSADGSSLRVNDSPDRSHAASTPDLQITQVSVQSEVYTNDSSNNSPPPAADFPLKTAIQKATAPTISESSLSATDFDEFPVVAQTCPPNTTELDKTAERPVSFPLAAPSNKFVPDPIRQSLPLEDASAVSKLPNTVLSDQFDNETKVDNESYATSVVCEPTAQLTDTSIETQPAASDTKMHHYSDIKYATPDTNTDLPHSVPTSRPRSDSVANTSHQKASTNHNFTKVVSISRPRADSAPLTTLTSKAAWVNAYNVPKQNQGTDFGIGENSHAQALVYGEPSTHYDHHSEELFSSATRRLSSRESIVRGSMLPSGTRGLLLSQHTPDSIDPRFSNSKYHAFALPDLTEDSQEDASTTNLRMLGARPHPFRSSGPRGPRGDAKSRVRASVLPPEPPISYLPRRLIDTKGLPSFTFSSTDLTATLNQALGFRSSKSMEEVRSNHLKHNGSARTTRLFSSDDWDYTERERYRSFFREDGEPTEEMTEDNTQKSVPEELLAEIDRISIPSVNGLALRLSELIPTLNRSSSQPDITRSDDALKATIEEIRELGSAARLASMDLKRDSLISTVSASQGRPKLTAINPGQELEDLASSRLDARLLNKALPPLPSDIMSPRPSTASASPLISGLDPRNMLAELEGTIPLTFASGSQVGTVREAPRLSQDESNNTQTSDADTAMIPATRPKRGDLEHVTSVESIELNKAPPATGRSAGSPLREISSNRKKSGSVYSDEHIRVARTMSPGPCLNASLIPESKVSLSLEKNRLIRKGPIGSLISKMGIRPRIDRAGFPIDPDFLHPEERATEPGDRYPTTGLTPPLGLNIEDNRSFFSDNSSEHEPPRIGTFRKRLTRVRQKRSISRAMSTNGSSSDTPRPTSATGLGGSVFGGSQLDAANTDMMFMMYDQPPTGMSRMEFRAKKMVERLRKLWFRSGRLIHNLAHHKKHAPGWFDASDAQPVTEIH